jgi:hypothetical protein
MGIIHPGVIVPVIIAGAALIVFLTIKNIRDKKKLLPPDSTDDVVNEQRMDQERRRDERP